jgi:flagella basal body P-ring formation protein FlgA
MLRLLLIPSLLLCAGAQAMTHTVDPARIRAKIEEDWAAVAPAGSTLEVRRVPTLTYDGSTPEISVTLPDDPSRAGPRALPVTCRAGGRVVSRGLANVIVRTERTVWKAARSLERGDTLRPEDLVAEVREFDREPLRIFAPDNARTFRLARDVDAGHLITSADVTAVPDVESGSEILLVSRAGAATVSLEARARQSGHVGDVILVHNPLTGEVVRARVIERGVAELVAPAASSSQESS